MYKGWHRKCIPFSLGSARGYRLLCASVIVSCHGHSSLSSLQCHKEVVWENMICWVFNDRYIFQGVCNQRDDQSGYLPKLTITSLTALATSPLRSWGQFLAANWGLYLVMVPLMHINAHEDWVVPPQYTTLCSEVTSEEKWPRLYKESTHHYSLHSNLHRVIIRW